MSTRDKQFEKIWQDALKNYMANWTAVNIGTPDPPPDPPELPVEKSATPIVGYRSWVVSRGHPGSDLRFVATLTYHPTGQLAWEQEPKPEAESGPYRLWSPIQYTEWTGPILRADGKPCPYNPHDPTWSGREDHCHGIYAHDAPEWRDYHSGRAIGRLEATGTVVVHERGFRAEAVRITQLVLAPDMIGTEAKEDLERIYGCDVTYNPEELLNGHR